MNLLKHLSFNLRPIFSTCTPTKDMKISPGEEWVADKEPLDEYQRTGYHPVIVGDVLDSRYRILRKLGWGAYSTVWLVQYESDTTQRFAALKLSTGVATKKLHELDYLKKIRDCADLYPGSHYVVHLLDYFYLKGPNGRHLCIVTEPLTESLQSFSGRWMNRRMPTDLVKLITRQIILAIDYLHDKCVRFR